MDAMRQGGEQDVLAEFKRRLKEADIEKENMKK